MRPQTTIPDLFLKERNLQKLRTGIRDGLLLERLFARSHDAKSSEKQRIAAFSLYLDCNHGLETLLTELPR